MEKVRDTRIKQMESSRGILQLRYPLSRSQISLDTGHDTVFTINMQNEIEASVNPDLQPEERTNCGTCCEVPGSVCRQLKETIAHKHRRACN